MTAIKTRALAIGAVFALTATACGSGEESATEDGLTPVTVGVLPITAVAPLYLGVEQGLFEEQGLDGDHRDRRRWRHHGAPRGQR